MRLAIFSVTSRGKDLSEKISQKIPDSTRFEKLDSLPEIFKTFDALIFVMAIGIVVRKIAPLLENKLVDPAVIVLDERGMNVVSLLSGHVGGANDLTKKIAAAIGANPVITTATDVEDKIAIDAVSNEMGLRIHPRESIKQINSAILNGERIRFSIDEEIPSILITDRYFAPSPRILFLTPRRLIAGIGCRRGVESEKILDALEKSCEKIGQPLARIDLLASVEIKSDELGLIEVSKKIDREIRFFSTQTLAAVIRKYNLEESDFVRDSIGVGNVCESSALACVDRGRFALSKTKFDSVTIALIWER